MNYSTADIIGIDIEDLDITDLCSVRKYFKQNNAHIIINCAAFTNVDLCETMIEQAFKVNTIVTKNLAIIA